MEIKLNNRTLTVESFYMTATYAGLLIGEPNEEINKSIISDISHPRNFTNKKHVFEESNMYLASNVLKPNIYSVHLTGKPINDISEDFHGSQLIVSWFGDNALVDSIEAIITNGLKDFDYAKHAENFQF